MMPEAMPMTLIFYRHKVDPRFPPDLAKRFEGSYNCGWLSSAHYILQWGNCKDKEAARSLMNDELKKNAREVLFYDDFVPDRVARSSVIVLTKEQYEEILSKSERWN